MRRLFVLILLLGGLSVSLILIRQTQLFGKKAAVLPETVYFVHADHLGSTSVITDSAGNAVSSRAYFAYGGTRSQSGSDTTDRLYTGQVSDTDETGLYYYNARYYNPTLAKFTQADPVNDQLNRYAYVNNNPVNRIDPSGHRYAEDGGSGGGTSILKSYSNKNLKKDIFSKARTAFNNNWESPPEMYFGNRSQLVLNDSSPFLYDNLYSIPILNLVLLPYSYSSMGSDDLVFSDYHTRTDYINYREKIFNDLDFNTGTVHSLLFSFVLSMKNNTQFNPLLKEARNNATLNNQVLTPLELSQIYGPESDLISRINAGEGVCSHFAAISNLLLGDLGIESEIIRSEKLNHALLQLNISNQPYIVDPTNGLLMPLELYSQLYSADDFESIGSYVAPGCPVGNCHNP